MVKSDIELVRRSNRALILRQLRRRGPTARTVLADETGLSSATVSSITGEMLEEGTLRPVRPETARAAGAAGRRRRWASRPTMPRCSSSGYGSIA